MKDAALNREQSADFLGVSDAVLGELVARDHLEPIETKRGWAFAVCDLRWIRLVLHRCRQLARAREFRRWRGRPTVHP